MGDRITIRGLAFWTGVNSRRLVDLLFDVQPLESPAYLKFYERRQHKCHCPGENFRIDGVGCVCGGI